MLARFSIHNRKTPYANEPKNSKPSHKHDRPAIAHSTPRDGFDDSHIFRGLPSSIMVTQ